MISPGKADKGEVVSAGGETKKTGAETVLEEAARIVDGDRNAAYGDPAGNHGTTAAMWTAYLQRRGLLTGELDARDVCLLNVLQKTSRDAHWRQRDNLTDICGYARNAELSAPPVDE